MSGAMEVKTDRDLDVKTIRTELERAYIAIRTEPHGRPEMEGVEWLTNALSERGYYYTWSFWDNESLGDGMLPGPNSTIQLLACHKREGEPIYQAVIGELVMDEALEALVKDLLSTINRLYAPEASSAPYGWREIT
jgi:hypothetical protein